MTLTGAAAPSPTLAFVLWTLLPGLGLLLPSLWLLFAVFKGRQPAAADELPDDLRRTAPTRVPP